jgi:antitoxin (DNA-binding transcriptional repressor) of toxin-antitoxin stability system
MKTVSIHDAKSNLSKYIASAKKGEKVYIGSFGKAEVVLVALPTYHKNSKRNFGVAKGKITAHANAFSESTDKEIAELLLQGD